MSKKAFHRSPHGGLGIEGIAKIDRIGSLVCEVDKMPDPQVEKSFAAKTLNPVNLRV